MVWGYWMFCGGITERWQLATVEALRAVERLFLPGRLAIETAPASAHVDRGKTRGRRW